MKEIIIYQPWGGLGDNLGHSPIPEMCHQNGIKCYLSNQNVYRSPEIYDLLWKNNLFLSGKKDSTDMSWLDVPIISQMNREWNELKNIQARYGLIPNNHYPKIYYKPNLIDELKDKTVINLSGYSIYKYQNFNQCINLDQYNKCIEKLVEKFNMTDLVRLIEKVDYSIKPNLPYIESINNTYDILSLSHYADIIFSCKNFITFNSGPAILASGIKFQYNTNSNIFVFNIEQLTPPSNYQCYIFKNTNYVTIDTQRILMKEE